MNRRTPILAALIFALWPLVARAAVVRTEPLYPAPAAPWSGAIGGALSLGTGASPLSLPLVSLASPALAPNGGFAPVVAQLEGSLSLTPAAFAALPLEQRRTALELAVEAAQGDLTQKAAELTTRARALSSPDKALDKEGRAELYQVVARLDEMRTRYGPLLQAGERSAVSDSYGRAAARAWAIRNALLNRSMKDAGAALNGAGRDQPAAPAAAAPAALPAPGKTARDLAAAMRNNAVGWKLRDLDHLLIGYGFTLDQGGKHRKYEFPGMKPEIVPRHTEVDPNYIKSALTAIARIESLRTGAPASRADAPASIDLEQLAVLLADEPKGPAAAAAPAPEAPSKRIAPAPRPAKPPARAPAPGADKPAAPADPARLLPATPRPPAEPKPEPPSASAPEPSDAFSRVLGRLKSILSPR